MLALILLIQQITNTWHVGNYTADEKLIYTANWLLNFIKKENQGNSNLSDK